MPRRRLRDLSIVQNPPNSEETSSEQQTTIGSSNVPNTADEPWWDAQNSSTYAIKRFIRVKFYRACQSS
ncbi:hypothetical protein Gotur_032639 [Gossypium turneri]